MAGTALLLFWTLAVNGLEKVNAMEQVITILMVVVGVGIGSFFLLQAVKVAVQLAISLYQALVQFVGTAIVLGGLLWIVINLFA